MHNLASASLSVLNQVPDFIKEENPLFEKFLRAYYSSQERGGGPVGILNNLQDYFNLSKYEVSQLRSNTKLISNILADSRNIEVETTDGFPDENGTILIDDEVIYYESVRKSPNVILTPDISYTEFNKKLVPLFNPYQQFDGIKFEFDLKVNNEPVYPPSNEHIIVKIYNEYQIPGVDYQILGDKIRFTNPPRQYDPTNLGDTSEDIRIVYLKGFQESEISVFDQLPILNTEVEEIRYDFKLKLNGVASAPSSTSLVIAIVDGNLLVPIKDFSLYADTIIFKEYPRESVFVGYINAPLLDVGDGASAVSVVNDDGQLESILVKNGGSGYRVENTPKVSLVKSTGVNATAEALVSGIKSVTLIDSGKGYSQQNPPTIVIQEPTNGEGSIAKGAVTVNDQGGIDEIHITDSGSGYDFVPRIQFVNPSGAKVGNVVVNQNGVVLSVQVLDGGSGYSTAPQIYIDAPDTENGIRALLQGNINAAGELVSVTVIAGGVGYSQTNLPRVAVIEPTGAQILDVEVDSFGRVIGIELLSGGFGYDDVPSVYIVDDRVDNLGNPIGGTGAKAVATVFNGEIIDINITEFGENYSIEFPPKVFISSPVGAKASAEIGIGEITGFRVINPGRNYSKSEFTGCSRGVSGIVDYDSEDNAVFRAESESIATSHLRGSAVKGLDAVFLRKIMEKIAAQYLPGLPQLDIDSIDISNVLRTVKDFYASKGTRNSIAYLFKILYGVEIDVSYPKDQIIKPSAATWSIDTILRARLIAGNPQNLKDSLLEQNEDLVDTNVLYASATIENFTAIQTANYDVYELILSEESINGKFIIPYKTRLAEPLSDSDSIITVDSTIGWPEKNGEVIIGTELIRYKEKSLTQFIECTRGINQEASAWDSGTICTSNFYVYANQGTTDEVILSVLGIVESGNTQLTDESSYYLPGDKLSVSKLGSIEDTNLIKSWLYNVKKLLKIDTITYGGVNNQTATVNCSSPHGLLVGDQVTVYGANPIVYNGSFLVTSRESATVFKYELPQPATLNPQGNILISIDLNKGKSDVSSINNSINKFATNIQNTFFNDKYVYVAASGIPNYKIGPFVGTSLLPGNQRKLYRFPKLPSTISLKPQTEYGPVGSFINGVSVWNYKSDKSFKYGGVTKVNITNFGKNYDAANPPVLDFVGGGGSGAAGRVVVNGSLSEIVVTNGGSGYTSSPLVSISGGGDGEGASATAIVTKGVVSRILVNTAGSGYTSKPTITITGGGGTGATAEAFVRGPIKEVVVDSEGQDYTSEPKVTLSSGEGAAAQAYVSNGRIVSIAVIASGSGYTTAPKVVITGDGYGAVARANIQTEGLEAGRVISVTILNRGIGYKPGTTQIRLESIGEGAEFKTEIFEWTYNLNNNTNFDYANGSIFEGFNKQFGGEYGHVSNPKQLRYVLGDNLTVENGAIVEKQSGIVHSPIIGWAFDGNPIYGPYGLSDPTNLSSNIVPIQSSYRLKTNLVFNSVTNPEPYRIAGPSLQQFPAGTFIEDYEYVFRSEAFYLDQYNGRFTKTPDFPEGTYAYFVTLNADGTPAFPYIIGPNFYSIPDSWNLTQFAVQSNIPTGIVRYRAPFENVDIDVERDPNESTNAITLENGDVLTFEIEDENRDGFIDSSEEADPDLIFEESKLELFDYFPKIDISSKVDIEVETTTKFEEAKISDFLIENPGENYQVNDRLVFNDEGTEGYGASASIKSIQGEEITSYTYEYNTAMDEYFGVVQTAVPHNMEVGDYVNVTTTPIMEPTSKTIRVITVKGLEEVSVDVSGIGYDPNIEVEAFIDSTSGQEAEVKAIVGKTGILDQINIINSGRGYNDNPKIRISHPQIQKRSVYYAVNKKYQSGVKINNSFVDSNKNLYYVGSVTSTNGDVHGYISKLNAEGTTLWAKSLTATQPASQTKRCELISVVKDGVSVYVVGQTYPNPLASNAFNPDIFVAKYTENSSGTEVNLTWQRELAGISGVNRNDYITDVAVYGENIVACGYTTTNSNGVNDGILFYISNGGDVLIKRKITSTSSSEKLQAIQVDSKNNIYVLGQSTTADNILIVKCKLDGSKINTVWQKEISYTNFKFEDLTLLVDEYDELYVTTALENSSTSIKTKLALIKLDSDGDLVFNKEYSVPNTSSVSASKSTIDVFGEIAIGYTAVDVSSKLYSGIIKCKFNGDVLNSYQISSLEGVEISKCSSDVSGDPTLVGNITENRTQFLYKGSTYSDTVGRYGNLTSTGTVTVNTDPKFGTNAYSITQNAKLSASSLTTQSNVWTIEGWIKWDSAATAKVPDIFNITDGTNSIKVAIFADTSSPSTYGKLRISNGGATISQFTTSSNGVTLLTSDYRHIAVTKSYNTSSSIGTYTLYFNGSQVAQITTGFNLNPTTIEVGSTTSYNSWPVKLDEFRYSNYAIAYTSAPTAAFTGFDYANQSGFVMKFDKNADSERMGFINLTNNTFDVTRSNVSLTVVDDLELVNIPYTLGPDGLQILDFNVATSGLTQDYHIPSTVYDSWSTRTATVPSPGGRKAVFSSKAFGKFFFNYFAVSKFDNIRKLHINQAFTFNIGTNLLQKNALNATVASAKIVDIDYANNYIYVADTTGSFGIDTGTLESSDAVVNEIRNYGFEGIVNTSPGTFIASIPSEVEATFKQYSDDDYAVRIDEIIPGSPYAKGSVVVLGSSFFSFNAGRTTATIAGLSSVTKITLITNLKKTLQIDEVSNTDKIYIRTSTSHYLNVGDNIYGSTSPEYVYANGSFYVNEILSQREFIFTLREVPGSFIGAGTQILVYVKHPVFKFIYGQQYTFDVSDPSNQGYYLSFYRDNLNKIEYTFKNIVRRGTPGLDAPGVSPFISFKVTDDVSNISYYADPSRIGEFSPVSKSSYIDVVRSPYIGRFEISSLEGATVTTGANKFKFKLDIDPEKNAQAFTSSYSTESTKVAGPISEIRLISGGGFYKKLPVITDIQSSRKIERVEIRNPGTEYEPGEYFGVPILGDGNGGRVRLKVDANSDPVGQIIEVVVTDPGKGYTEAFIDVDAIDGILGPNLTGSGAVLEVIIPPKGTGASIFVKGENVGKIKKLRNNNFGFDYTHDYTLRPEITFPVNLQLINTSVLSSIKVIDPGSGYTSVPEVVITGGGGTGAIAEAEIRNGRISGILIKNPGFGYSTEPKIELKSSFTYVINLDLGLFQLPFPHGIANGSELTFDIQDLGEGAAFPITSFGYIIPGQIYYAIAGESAGLENDQLRIALTPGDAESGNYISFVNTGTGRQILLTNSFGGSAEAVVETGRFLSGELVYQGDSLENASAKGYVSENEGWQIGPRLLKLINTEGTFAEGQIVTGTISKASGTINNINAAKGVIQVDSITKTAGKFLDDVGKTNEIVQKVQDSYLYQSFSYNIKSPVSIDQWKTIVLDNTHPTGFKLFGEIGVYNEEKGLTDKTDFQLTKSVNLIESSVVANIDNFGLVEPVYKEFDNTQVLFRTKRLTSSEEILTSYVQKIDNIANLFDGERTSFPLTIDGSTIIANTSQVKVILNGIAQAPGESYEVQQGNIVFKEAPPAPTKVSYANLTLQFLTSYEIEIENLSGILPELGQTIRGLVSLATATVISSTTSTIKVFNINGTFQPGEIILGSATGLNANLVSVTALENTNTFQFQEAITNTSGKTAIVEEINLDANTSTVTNQIVISKTSGTYDSPSGLLAIKFNDYIVSAKTGIIARVTSISPYIDPATGEPLSSISISDPSSFSGLLYNRIVQPEYPNVIIDDISKSSVEVVDLDNGALKVEGKFPEFEIVSSTTFENVYDDSTTFQNGEFVQNIEIEYINSSGDFDLGETVSIQKLAYKELSGGNFQAGDTITTSGGFTAKVVGVSYAFKYLFLGEKSGTFNNGDTISTDKSFVSNDDIVSGRYADASDLILANKLLIADVAVGRMLANFPGFTVPGGNQNCKDDIISILDELCFNVKYGGNHRAYDVAQLYIDNGYLSGEETQSVYAINQARDLAIQAMRNETITLGGHTSRTQVKDLTVEGDQSGQPGVYIPGDCADVASTITTLFAIVTQGISTGSISSITRTNIGTVTAKISAYLDIPFNVEQVHSANDKIITYQFYDDTHHRFRDAANLIRLNATYIIEEAAGRMKNLYSDLVIPGDEDGTNDGTSRCKLDLNLLLQAVADDIEKGGNYNTLTGARFYIDENGGLRYITKQVLQSLYAHEQMNLLCQQAVIGELSQTPEYTEQTPIKPLEITVDPGDCADVRSKIDTLWSLINEVLCTTGDVYKDASNALWFNRKFIAEESVGLTTQYFTYFLNGVRYNAFVYPNGQTGETTCVRDIKDYIIPSIIADLISGGDANTIEAMKFYVSATNDVLYVKDELLPTIYALEQANILCQYAVDNWRITGTNTIYQAQWSSTPKYTDNTITVDDGTYGGQCANIKSAIDTLFTKAISILLPERDPYQNRKFDAANLIEANKELIAEVAVGRMLAQYPGFTIPNGNQNCIDDIIAILGELCFNIRYGGNHKMYDAAQLYITNGYLAGEETQAVYAFNQARDMAIEAMRNETITLGGYTTKTQFKDLDITVDTSNPKCANVASAITTLFAILSQAVQSGNLNGITRTTDSASNIAYRNAAKLIMFNKNYIKAETMLVTLQNYPNFSVPGGNDKCLRDMGYIMDAIIYDLLTNGNSAILFATQSYIDAATGTIISLQGELVQSIFAFNKVKDYMKRAIAETLVSPAPATGFYAYTDTEISLSASEVTEINAFIDDKMSILLNTLNNSSYIEDNQIIAENGITLPDSIYPTRLNETGILGGLNAGDYIYGITSNVNGEIKSITTNRATVKKLLVRVRVNFSNPIEIFSVGETITRQGFASITGKVYSYSYSENFNYVDIVMTSGQFAVGNILINDDGFVATVVSVSNKVQVSDLIGSFANGQKIKGFKSNATSTISNFTNISAPVLDNTGSKLTLDTESYFGNFEVSSVIYSSVSDIYIDVNYYEGTQIGLADIIQTTNIYKLTLTLPSEETSTFEIGGVINNESILTQTAVIIDYINDGGTVELYIGNLSEEMFDVGDTILYYEQNNNFPVGVAQVASSEIISSEAYGFVERIIQVGAAYRLYLSNVKGTFNQYAQTISKSGYRSIISSVGEVVGRIDRSFRGFDGVQTTFKLTITNGTPYYPNPDGHLLVYVNGVLQPPEQSYTTFSDIIQFTEPPELGATFHSSYIGKLRKLDDISFEFDSLRNSFNLKLNEVFYSLTVTAGSESSNIKPENNLIVSLNGVIQEPGVAFELVGSRIIFAEIPRAGSSFVAFSYIGSDADVIAADVVPPIETGDELEIEGEDKDRTVAIIESSNSLVTFDYTGSVFGRNASALTDIITGRIKTLSITSSGDGYTSRPSVSVDSATGFDAQIKALVGVSRVDLVNAGSGYLYPIVEVVNEVPDDEESFLFDSTATSFDGTSVTFDQS